jgi:putative transposase
VPKGARRAGGLDEMIISLYAGGMTVRDIQRHLARTLGTDLSPDTISSLADAVLEEVKAWKYLPLEETYPIVYPVALVVKVRDGHRRRTGQRVASGIDLDSVKDVLGIPERRPESRNLAFSGSVPRPRFPAGDGTRSAP